MIGLLIPYLSKTQVPFDRIHQIQTNRNVAFALKWYQREHRRYPAELRELAPKYLTRIQLDCFSGKALIYRPRADGYILYSVGPNGEDEQGRGHIG
jgi:hypothetical protein